MKHIIISFIIGMIINKAIIKPIETRYWRNKCIKEHLAPQNNKGVRANDTKYNKQD